MLMVFTFDLHVSYFLNLFFIIVIQRKTNKSRGLFRIVTLQGKNNV
jgi:hypothetical protein